MNQENRFAVLIDADNVSEKYIRYILDEVTNSGIATYKRIYGDWTKPALGSWKNVLLSYSITPIQQYGYTTGKNATDSAMIIDAMDILYSGNIEGFCLVSSDSDFTRLASRLREGGMEVIGMGEKKTPAPFIAACNRFRYLEVLAQEATDDEDDSANTPKIQPVADVTSKEVIAAAILSMVRDASDEDGRLPISDIGNMLARRYPDFDSRNYGFKKLTQFVKSLNLFDIIFEPAENGRGKVGYVAEKEIHRYRPRIHV